MVAIIAGLLCTPPAKPMDSDMPAVLARLDDDDWQVREAASAGLRPGHVAVACLLGMGSAELTAEQRTRLAAAGARMAWDFWRRIIPDEIVEQWRAQVQGGKDCDPSVPWWAKP